MSYRTTPNKLFCKNEKKLTSPLYVIGGLYGNTYALQQISKLASSETVNPQLAFNGDFNFLQRSIRDYEFVNEFIQESSDASLGNLEMSIFQKYEQEKYAARNENIEHENLVNKNDYNCGCDYPPFVNADYVNNSNLIAESLYTIAKQQSENFTSSSSSSSSSSINIIDYFKKLPKFLRYSINSDDGYEHKILVIHGDVMSLSGWRFSAEAIEPYDEKLREQITDNRTEMIQNTSLKEIREWMKAADADIIACTHTCLPVATTIPLSPQPQDAEHLPDMHRKGVLINNGAAGMPNFYQTHYGILTRIAHKKHAVPEHFHTLYSYTMGDIMISAVAIDYNHEEWLNQFLSWWPEGTPAYSNYYNRISNGPSYSIEQANRLK